MDLLNGTVHSLKCASKYYYRSDSYNVDINMKLFEKTPSYFCFEEAPYRISKEFPDVKLIALLRNPVDRLYSWVNFEFRQNNKKEKNLCEGLEQKACVENWIVEFLEDEEGGNDDTDVCNDEHRRKKKSGACSPLNKGIYVDQIKRWRDHFPETQLLFVKSEDMYENPRAIYDHILQFLDVSLEYGEDEVYFGKTNRTRSYEEMTDDLRERVKRFYEPHNQRLYEYLGRDFGWE